MSRINNSKKQKLPITQQFDIQKKQVEVKKKKSETTLQQTGTNKIHLKSIEMQKQMQCLIIEIKHLKTCNTLSKQNDNESTEIAQQNPEIAPLLLQPPLDTNCI